MRVLVTGGAGYVGSHTVAALLDAGHRVTVYDNLSQGHARATMSAPLANGDVQDTARLKDIIRTEGIQAIIHFAACSLVAESVSNPQLYYLNNVCGTLSLLQAAIEEGVQYFVFSSSAAVYGEPLEVPIPETHPLRPTNP